MREVRGLPGALPGVGGAQDEGQGDQHPAGALRRRRHDGQLDELVPHAGGDARVLGARTSASPASRVDDLAPWFARMEARLSIAPWDGRRPTPTTRRSRAARRRSASRPAAIRRNVKGCANLGYCGMGCPTQRQAVDAGDDDPGGARPRRDARHARAGARVRAGAATASWRSTCAAMDAARRASRPRAGSRCARAPSSRRRARSARRRCCCAAGVPDPHGARRQAHVPASDGGVGGADAGRSRRPITARRRPSTPTTSSTRCRWTVRSGYKLEAPPLHPILAAITLPGHGAAHARWMRELPQPAGAARAAARRLPSGQPRRHAWRCAATARRCSTTR